MIIISSVEQKERRYCMDYRSQRIFTPDEYARIVFNRKVTGKTVRNWILKGCMPVNTTVNQTPTGRYLIEVDDTKCKSKADALLQQLCKRNK